MFDFLTVSTVLQEPEFPLVEILLKSTMVVTVAALLCRLLRRQSAALRHRVWVLGLASALIVPPAVYLLPRISLPVLPGQQNELELGAAPGLVQSASTVIKAPTGSVPAIGEDAAGDILEATTPVLPPTAQETSEWAERRERFWHGLAAGNVMESLIWLAWLTGTVISLGGLLVALVRQTLALRRLRVITEADWANSLTSAAGAVGLQRRVLTLESPDACVPAVAGIFFPRLIVPRNWPTWSQVQRQCILLHELAHIKRQDVATQLLGRLALAMYWFNPLVWLAVRQLRVERELASDDCVLLSGQLASDYAEQLLQTLRSYRPSRVALGVAMAHSARLDQRVLAILDAHRRREPVGSRLAFLLVGVAGVACTLLGVMTLSTATALAAPPADTPTPEKKESVPQMWREIYTVEFPGCVPVSVAFSVDGKVLLTGDTNGEAMALVFTHDDPRWKWKSQIEGGHAAVAFSADQKSVYATTKNGVRILNATNGAEEARIEVPDSNPLAVGVFPDKRITEDVSRSQIVFGNPRGYHIPSWVPGRVKETLGEIETSTAGKDREPADAAVVPLAVDPQGRCAIMTGPIDGTGEVAGQKGKNVLWAYVCGDYSEGSPGNRVMVGHTATVVSAAWAKTGNLAVTGDTVGHVIVWDTTTMKESHRHELGGRVLALATTHDGTQTAAWVVTKEGCQLYLWETVKPIVELKPIHTEVGDFAGPAVFGSLSFSPDGKQLAGCAINKVWLTRLGELIGKVRVWELVKEPKAQPAPAPLMMKPLPKGTPASFVVLDNTTLLTLASKDGAVDLRSISDGSILARLTLGTFQIGGVKLSSDRQWLALDQHTPFDPLNTSPPARTFEVGVYTSTLQPKASIPDCLRTLDVASGGKVIAVVRENGIEVWDIATAKLLKSAPFKHKRIDAAAFAPNGKLLAISDQNDLVLWNWENDQHERIELGRSVGSLEFSPDGKFLAEGPSPRHNIQIRELATRKVVRELDNGTKLSMDVPSLAYTQGGRVLIACDDCMYVKEIVVPYRINLWDTVTGAITHQIALPAGLPRHLEVSPNGRHLVVIVEDAESGLKLAIWRLDGQTPAAQPDGPPAATTPE